MIEQQALLKVDENGYKQFNHFEVHETLEAILFEDYYNYNNKDFNKQALIEELYNKNFVNKYDREQHQQIFELYINNTKFKEKAQFVYALIDEDKYKTFAQANPEIENPNELTITYSILDSEGVKVQMYQISIADIAFLF